MKKQVSLGMLVLVSAMLLAGCARGSTGDPTAVVGTAADLENTKWKLTSFEGSNAGYALMQEQPLTLEFQPDGMLGGFAGCNGFGGAYMVEDGLLKITDVVSTLMACADDAVTQQESRFLQALAGAGRFEVNGDALKIWYEDGESALNFVRAP